MDSQHNSGLSCTQQRMTLDAMIGNLPTRPDKIDAKKESCVSQENKNWNNKTSEMNATWNLKSRWKKIFVLETKAFRFNGIVLGLQRIELKKLGIANAVRLKMCLKKNTPGIHQEILDSSSKNLSSICYCFHTIVNNTYLYTYHHHRE